MTLSCSPFLGDTRSPEELASRFLAPMGCADGACTRRLADLLRQAYVRGFQDAVDAAYKQADIVDLDYCEECHAREEIHVVAHNIACIRPSAREWHQ